VLGLGPLEELVADEGILDVIIDRHDRVLVDRGSGLTPAGVGFSSETSLRRVLERLVAPLGRTLDEHAPVVDTRLPDGARLTIVAGGLAARGPCFTLRKPRRAGPSQLAQLVAGGTLSRQMADFLSVCINARRNLIVCGGAGAARSQLLGALADLAPPAERVISVEEISQLSLGREAWVALESGGRPLADLVRTATHLGPDRLVVGEVGGAEAWELLLAMAGGHQGALASVPADGVRAALAQLDVLARLGAGMAPARAVRDLVASAVHVVVHLARWADGQQRVASIVEVTRSRNGEELEARELFHFQVQGRAPDGAIRGKFAALGVIPRFYEELEAQGIAADPAVFR
jgi:pilus assembly protein CpaF